MSVYTYTANKHYEGGKSAPSYCGASQDEAFNNVAEPSAGRPLHFLKRLINITWRFTEKKKIFIYNGIFTVN